MPVKVKVLSLTALTVVILASALLQVYRDEVLVEESPVLEQFAPIEGLCDLVCAGILRAG